MRRFTAVFLIVIVLFTLILSGCSTTNQGQPQNQPQASQEEVPDGEQGLKTKYPLTIVDDIGATVTIPAKPTRIVSLLPSSTEILCALGEYPVAVTKWDDYPADVKEKAEYVFEDALNPNLEQILNLEPDLIMYWLASAEDTKKIKSLGIPVVVFEAKSIDDVYKSIATAGQITDKQEQAALIIEEMKAKEKRITEKLAQLPVQEKRKVWMEVDSKLFTAGKGTFLHEVITKAGGINIAEDVQGWVQFNSEQVIARNPDVIFENYSYSNPNAAKIIKDRKGWENIEAVKNNRIISLDNNIISRQGPRIIDALELTAKAIYPELF
ncbi:MAG TPA: ABC transporter substrate-binding protein [Peptococcaceae bacterium]|nr:ABC transporter substrate-binding protein [Peptococcaceae bacterium]